MAEIDDEFMRQLMEPSTSRGRSKKTPDQLKAEKEYEKKTRPRTRYMTEQEDSTFSRPDTRVEDTIKAERRRIARLAGYDVPAEPGEDVSVARHDPSAPTWIADPKAKEFAKNNKPRPDEETTLRELQELPARTNNETKTEREQRLSETDQLGPYLDQRTGKVLRPLTQLESKEEIRRHEDAVPIRIPTPSHVPMALSHHPLLAEQDHDPREICNGLGHVVTIWNGDGAVPGLPRDRLNLGLLTGLSVSADRAKHIMSQAIVDEHHRTCGDRPITDGKNCEEGCPFRFHYDHCGGTGKAHRKHDEACPLGDYTRATGDIAAGRGLVHVTALSQASAEQLTFGRRKPDFNRFTQEATGKGPDREYSIKSDIPTWKEAGMGGVRKGIVTDAGRVIHVPDAAVQSLLKIGEQTGKVDMRQFLPWPAIGGRTTPARFTVSMSNPLSQHLADQLRPVDAVHKVLGRLQEHHDNPETRGTPLVDEAPKEREKTTEEKASDDFLSGFMENLGKESSIKKSYTHVNESFERSAPCRFCDDPGNTNGKGPVVQTGIATDGRPLYAHEECDNPFEFADKFKHYMSPGDLSCQNCGGPCDRPGLCTDCFNSAGNIIDVDFIPSSFLASHNYGITPETRKIDKELGITTPSTPPVVDPGFNRLPMEMKIPKLQPATRKQTDNTDEKGHGSPPVK